ncbi:MULTISPECIES: efflux RND transporter permease subunit [Massilia]|uniref:Efflux RND transporter permease subunit n=1 Tax=Massilia haematophila TaxID=457923 RepID=A0ABV7PT39_9BURK|nr:efflux RND transporter permease subunit [Massilia sp.]HBZ05128.1 hypothetical protein [Massilia sp.]
MPQASRFLMAASLLPLACAAQTQAAPAVVAVEYRVASQSPEHIEESLVTPLERRLSRLPGLSDISSVATHGRARLEIGFAGDEGGQALAAVKAEVDRFDATSGLEPAAVVEFDRPRLDFGFLAPRRPGDADQPGLPPPARDGVG